MVGILPRVVQRILLSPLLLPINDQNSILKFRNPRTSTYLFYLVLHIWLSNILNLFIEIQHFVLFVMENKLKKKKNSEQYNKLTNCDLFRLELYVLTRFFKTKRLLPQHRHSRVLIIKCIKMIIVLHIKHSSGGDEF